jgi:TPR repeat protein/DNA polymerase III delta prime subunit
MQDYCLVNHASLIRRKEFTKVMRDLQDSSLASSIQHFLIEGQRGTGKTSLLLRINYEIEHNPALDHLIAVQFAEEQYGIFDLCSLWEKSAEILENHTGFEDILDVFDTISESDNYTVLCFSVIEKYLIKNNKRMVLLLDNVNDILDKLSSIEQKRLRDIFHTSVSIQLISASVKALEHTYRHDMPFFEFFRIIRLRGLDKADTIKLLVQLSENNNDNMQYIIQQQPSRIEILRRLTGGIPRTIVLLYRIFIDNSASIFDDLEQTLDRVTPLYKHRMDDLPAQQQAIVNTMALHWDGMSTEDIASQLKNRGFSLKPLMEQLHFLEQNELILSKNIDADHKIYLLKERFFNIWYLMRYGRNNKKLQVRWLIRFLEEWCDNDEIIHRAKQHINYAKQGQLHRKGYYMAEALAPLITDVDLQHEMLHETKKALSHLVTNIDTIMSPSDKELFQESYKHYKNNNLEEAVIGLKKLVAKGDSNAMFNLANLYNYKYKDIDQAKYYYLMAVDKKHPTAMFNLANIYKKEYRDNKKSMHYYLMAIEYNHPSAMFNLANLYQSEYKDLDKAIYYYSMAIKYNHANAMFNLANLYKIEYQDNKKSIYYYLMAVEKGHANAMFNLANLYQSEYKDIGQAIHYYSLAAEQGHSNAMFNLAKLYQTEYKDIEQAIHYYMLAADNKDANAINNLSKLYSKKGLDKVASSDNSYNPHILATMLLWNNRYKKSIKKIKKILVSPNKHNDFFENMIDYFLLLLAKKQFQISYTLFSEFPYLKQQFKPIYYALMHFLKDEYPQEHLKMGSELEETVNEIFIKINEKAKCYD